MDFDLKPTSNKEGIVTIAVSDEELQLFPLLLNYIEKKKLGEREGGVLLCIQDWKVPPALNILTALKPIIRNTLCEQRLVKSVLGQDKVYGTFPGKGCTSDVLETFISNYDEMICQVLNGTEQRKSEYSKIYKECGAEGMVAHFFDLANKFSCKQMSRHADPLLVFDFDCYKQELKEKAKKLKLVYGEKIASLTSLERKEVQQNEEKPTHQRCSCVDCFYSSSDTDEDVTYSKVEKNRNMQRKKSTYFVKGADAAPVCTGGIHTYQHFNITSNFSLCKTNSILDALPEKYLGVHIPHYYIGGPNSFFPAHQEDNGTFELSFLFAGAWQIWIIVHESLSEKLEDALSKSNIHNAHSSCRCLLLHKFFLPTIEFLKANKISYNIIVQRPGDLVLLYPDTVHWGFNTSMNVSSSCNVGTIGWLRRAVSKRKRCSCMSMEQIHLPLELLAAIFAEDLLPTLFHEEKNAVFDKDVNHPIECLPTASKVGVGHYYFKCPHYKCDAAYSFHKKRLVNHIIKKHPDSKEELLKRVKSLYPTRKRNESLYKHLCEPCGRTYCGSRTIFERHLKNASKPGNGSLESNLKHAKALALFQNEMVGYRRNRKKKD